MEIQVQQEITAMAYSGTDELRKRGLGQVLGGEEGGETAVSEYSMGKE